jgi:predicted nucleic acid-binding protein
MIAVDTSIWIEYLRNKDSDLVPKLTRLLDDEEVLLPAPVWIELLTGAGGRQVSLLRETMSALPRAFPTRLTWKTMENWIVIASKKGLRFAMGDLLIAAIATEQGAKMWSLDQDFAQMAKLKFIQFYC